MKKDQFFIYSRWKMEGLLKKTYMNTIFIIILLIIFGFVIIELLFIGLYNLIHYGPMLLFSYLLYLFLVSITLTTQILTIKKYKKSKCYLENYYGNIIDDNGDFPQDELFITGVAFSSETYCSNCGTPLTPSIFQETKKGIIRPTSGYFYYCRSCYKKHINKNIILFHVFLNIFQVIIIFLAFSLIDFLFQGSFGLLDFILIIMIVPIVWMILVIPIIIVMIINFKKKYI
ncbi:MAG: hypothetical protein ACFFBP_06935 [Promethearchaeota archaeon]